MMIKGNTEERKVAKTASHAYTRTRNHTGATRALLVCVLFVFAALAAIFGFNGFAGKKVNLTEGNSEVAYAADSANAAAWRTAVETNGTFKLGSDWVASVVKPSDDELYQVTDSYKNSTYRTEFGRDEGVTDLANSKAFVNVSSIYSANNPKLMTEYSGALFVPKGHKVTLDLNGHKLDRNLTKSEADGGLGHAMNTHGYVIRVEGELIIQGEGTITGGWNSTTSGNEYASAICIVNGGKVTLKSGTISGNINYRGGTVGLYYYDTDLGTELGRSTFIMEGGSIENNQSTPECGGIYNAGGVYLDNYCYFKMTGGTITHNTGFVGGVGMYTSGVNTFDFSGGKITENKSLAGDISYAAGGISAYSGTGTINMSGDAEISHNEGPVGAISLTSATLNMTGGSIIYNHHRFDPNDNTKIGDKHWNAGAIYAYNSSVVLMSNDALISQNTGTVGGISLHGSKLTMDGGKITENSADLGATTYSVGGVLSYSSCTFNMNDGEISNNRGRFGGVDNVSSSTFNMYGGKITGNVCNKNMADSANVAGVYSDHYFNMYDGLISGNYSANAEGGSMTHGSGGVVSHGTFTMYGGEISDNYGLGTSRGVGGVGSNDRYGTINLYGGKIINNIGYISGGVYKYSGSAMNVQYNPVVKENYVVDVPTIEQITDGTVKTRNDIDLYCGRINPQHENRQDSGWRTNVINVVGGLQDTGADKAELYVFKYTNNYTTDAQACITSNYYVNNAVVNPADVFHPSLPALAETIRVTPPSGYFEAGFYSKCDAQNWQDAVAASNVNNVLTVKLNYNWTATDYLDGATRANQKRFRAMFHNDDTGFSAGALTLGTYVILDLNGKTIDRDVQSPMNDSYVIYQSGGSFEITDTSAAGNGLITGGNNVKTDGTGCGGGVFVAGGTFTLSGGHIDGNKANHGGGVYVGSGTTNIKGGVISNNEAIQFNTKEEIPTTGFGGGIYIINPVKLTVSGGTISGNSAVRGGGIEVWSKSYDYAKQVYIILKGGEIFDNTATYAGGGIDIFQINSNFSMANNPIVKNNLRDGEPNDIQLPSQVIGGTANIDNGFITIIGRLTGSKDDKYGIYRDVGYTFTKDFKANNSDATPEDYFVAQKDGYTVQTNEDGDGDLISTLGKDNWFSAVILSQINGGRRYTVKLTEDWAAVRNINNNFNTSLYGDWKVDNYYNGAQPYYYGALNVPSGADIVLDLNGHTIDRGLQSGSSYYGFVIALNGGTLTIRDTSKDGDGKITGGWVHNSETNYYGGGISVFADASRLYLEGGNITKNKSTSFYNNDNNNPRGVGGVSLLAKNARFTMTGGTISNNIGSFAGGVAFNTLKANTFNLGGSAKVYGNTIGVFNTAFGDGTPSDVHNKADTAGSSDAHMKDPNTYKITIVSPFTSDAHIGISRPDVNNFTFANTNGNVFTRNYSQYNAKDPDNFFFPSNGKQSIIDSYTPTSGGREATIRNVDPAKSWSDAHAANVSATTGAPILVKLEYDWLPDKDGRMGTGSGFNAEGSLYMTQSNIKLDLNGYTIDRGLIDDVEGLEHGYVIGMNGTCRLEIVDSSPDKTGKITGGHNITEKEGGGINVANQNSYLILNGGTITNNKGVDGGVATYFESTFVTTNYFAMGESALVTGNLDDNNNDLNINLRAKYNQQIDILSTLTAGGEDGQKSGIYKESSSDFTKGFWANHEGCVPTDYFVNDSSQHYVIQSPSKEAALYSMDNYSNWKFAVGESIATNSERTVMLVSDWDAPYGNFGKSSTDTGYYSGGALYVPAAAKIVLDLNGYTLNRNLSYGVDYGFVIQVEGKFTLCDNYSGDDETRIGRMIGGNNITGGSQYAGGGINNMGTTYIKSGIIENNSSSGDTTYSTGGVFNSCSYASNYKLFMDGGIIRNNHGDFTGGINVSCDTSVNLGGSAQVYGNRLTMDNPSDIRPTSDSSANKIIVSDAFVTGDNGARIGVAYIGNNYITNLTSNIFTTNFNTANPGVDPSTVFHYSDPLKYRVIAQQTAGNGSTEAAVECIDPEQNWRQAVENSSTTVTHTVVLDRDWIAHDDVTYEKSFGADGSEAFYFGALRLPANRSVILDLNGHKMDRALERARTQGHIIWVQGNLEITDSSASQKGMITGGNSTDTPGAIRFHNGSLKLTGGKITGNRGTVGGVDVCRDDKQAAPMSMGGSAVVVGNLDLQNKKSEIVANNAVQMIDIVSKLTSTEKTGFTRPGVGDFTTNFAKVMNKADPKEYFDSTDPMYVYKSDTGEAANYTNDNKTNWEYAVKASIAGNKKQIKFMLVGDWKAADGVFGTDVDAYTLDTGTGVGALFVPTNADIVLDLNGYTLDRGLVTYISEGYVIRVYGNLTIRDSSQDGNGVLKGGHNNYNSSNYAAQSGAIFVNNGAKLNVEGGIITENYAMGGYSSAITASHNGASITITGGKIINNHGGNKDGHEGAGGIYVMTSNDAVKIGGSAYILDNHHTRNYDCDVRFHANSYYITVISQFTSKAKIGVAPYSEVNNWSNASWTSTNGGVQFTKGYSAWHTNADEPSRYFVGRWYQKHNVSKIVSSDGIEGSFWCAENYTNWIYACAASNTNKPVTFELSEDWTAEKSVNVAYSTSFHPTDTSYYQNGAIMLPSGRFVVLDLKGYTIDRSLIAKEANGYAIYVRGRLEIIDTSNKKTGKIIGANNADGGGGVVVHSGGTVCIKGGTITNNIGKAGAGVYILDGGHVEIGGNAQIVRNIDHSGENSNLYLNQGNEKVKVVSLMRGAEPIGVSRPANGYVTTDFQEYMPGSSPLDFFVSENPNYYGIESGDGELFFLSPDNYTNWEYAVTQSLANSGKMQTVRLTGNWLASAEGATYGTSFGTGKGFYNGALYVPAGASIELDLAGFTVSRNLPSASRFGTVIVVLGNLTVTNSYEPSPGGEEDGKSGGIITGGKISQSDTNFQAGGVHVGSNARFELLGGTITDNRDTTGGSEMAGGVFVCNGGVFVIKNAAVTGNSSSNAGVYIYDTGIFSVGGAAVVKDNGPAADINRDIVFRSYTSTINVVSALTDGAHLTVYRAKESGTGVDNYDSRSFGGSVISSNYGRYNSESPNTYFFASDAPKHDIIEYKGVGVREAALFCYDNEINWKYAVDASTTTRNEMTVKLYSDWTAKVENATTTFGYTASSYNNAYHYGALRVPSSAQIVLDLNNYVLDRALTSQATNNCGYVIYVEGGASLKIIDTSLAGAGQITGGWNNGTNIQDTSYGSGIHVNGNGKLSVEGGTITGNKGVGVYLAGNNIFSLGGKSRIVGNGYSKGSELNIYMDSESQLINVVSKFHDTAEFGVMRTKKGLAGGTLTQNYSKYNKDEDKLPSDYFVSNDPSFNVVDDGYFDDETMEASLLGRDNLTNWANAVKKSVANGGRPQVCTLYSDWTAPDYNAYTTSFGENEKVNGVDAFRYGALFVPDNCHVILDLNGYTLSRNLTNPTDAGSVIHVYGTLTIRDSSAEQTGKITGGYNNGGYRAWWNYDGGAAGGIIVYIGTLNIEGGTIEGNKSTNTSYGAGGVYISGGSTFNMTGGKITDNAGAYKGGLCAWDNATVSMGATATIIGNHLLDAKTGVTQPDASNLYFQGANNLVNVINTFSTDAKVGISVNPDQIDPDGRFITSGWVDRNGDVAATKVFSSDNVDKYILEEFNDGKGHEALLHCRDNMTNWQKTVIASQKDGGKTKTFKLYGDWTATSDSGSGTSFGSGTGYYGGAIYVPGNASIILDLNGYTIDRALANKNIGYNSYGYVILVDGVLKVIDSTAKLDASGDIKQGKITGGYGYDGGGIYVNYYGNADVEAGFITGNKVYRYGAGIFYYHNRLTIGGTVQFSENYTTNGGNSTEVRDDIMFWYNSNVLYIGDKITTGSNVAKNDIYIRKGNMGTFTSGYGTNNAEINPETRFKSYEKSLVARSTGSGSMREVALLSNNNKDNWTFAVNASRSAGGAPERFTLMEDWTAGEYNAGSYKTSFGTEGNSYRYGALLVPYGANIVLDLQGFTLHRSHDAQLDKNYPVQNATIIVEGTLQIIDSSTGKNGVIKGGSYGVYVNHSNASVTIGGLIKTHDVVANGVNAYGTEIGGGNISENSQYGVYVNYGSFTATAGKVTKNTSGDVFVSKNDGTTVNVAEKAYLYTPDRVSGIGAGVILDNPLGTINVISKMTADARVGYMRQGVGKLTNGWGKNNNNSDKPDTIFISEQTDKFTPSVEKFDDYNEVTVSTYDSAINWQYVINKSLSTGKTQEFTLYGCWIAQDDATYKTSFGTGTAYRNGALYVPEGAKIILNLNKHQLNRNLPKAADDKVGFENGLVIYVDGELEIKDEAVKEPHEITCCEKLDGAITGGFNSTASSGAAISIGKTGSVVFTSGNITGNKATNESASSGAVYNAGSFVMTGGSIHDNTGYTAGAVYVTSSASFTMDGGSLNANTAQGGGGAVYTTGEFLFNKGSITGNKAVIGGVYVASGGRFTMETEASITNNEGSSAGAVFVNNGSNTYFHMNGGTITGNTGNNAGAIYAAGKVEIAGGEIKSNKAEGTSLNAGGGAIYISGTGNVAITGGDITANTGANGIRVHASGVIGVGGKARIYENIATHPNNPDKNEADAGPDVEDSNDYCDIYLTAASRKVDVISKFEDGARVGIYRRGAGTFTKGYGVYNAEAPKKYFESNRSIFTISGSAAEDITDVEGTIGIPVDPEPSALTTPNVYNGQYQTIINNIDTTKVTVGTLDNGVRVFEDVNKNVTIQAVNAGNYTVSFKLKDAYSWSDGSTDEKIVLASIAPKTVSLVWTDETHDGKACVYDGTTAHIPTAAVTASDLVTNVLGDGSADVCDVNVTGQQVNASSGDGHVATAVSLTNSNYQLGTDDVEYKFVVEKAERPDFAITTTDVYYNTFTKIEVTGNPENGKLSFKVDTADSADAEFDLDKGEIKFKRYDANNGTTFKLTVVAAETDNYKEATATQVINCIPGELKTEIAITEMQYGEQLPLSLKGYNASEMGKITWNITYGSGEFDGSATLKDSSEIYAANIGKVKVTAQVAQSKFYKETTITGTVTIKPRVITLDWGEKLTTEYNGEAQTLTAPEYSNVLASDGSFEIKVYQAGSAGWNDRKYAPTWTDAGEYPVGLVLMLNGQPTEKYTLENEDAFFNKFVIEKATINPDVETTEAYYGVPFKPVVTGNDGNGAVTISCTGSSFPGSQYKYDFDTQEYTAWALGTMNFTITIAETPNYKGAQLPRTFKIVEAQMPVEIAPESLTYGTKKTLTSSYINGEGTREDVTSITEFAVNSETSEYASIVLNGTSYEITPLKAGTVKIDVTVQPHGSYIETKKTIEIEIKPCPLMVEWTFDEDGYTYDGTKQNPTATLTGAPIGADEVAINGYMTYQGEEEKDAIHAGTYKVAALFDNPNYVVDDSAITEFTIKPRPVELTWTNTKFTYSGGVQAPTATVSNIIKPDVCNVTVLGTDKAGTDLTATATQLDNEDYTLTDGIGLTTTFFIEQKVLTVEWEGVDPDTNTVDLVYTGVSQSPKAVAKGMLGDDTCDVIIGGAQINVNNPDEPYTATASGLTNPNYKLESDFPVKFNITRADIEVTLKQKTAVYGTPFTLEVEGNTSGGTVTYKLAEGETKATIGTGAWFTPNDVGTVKIIINVAATDNYAGITDLEQEIVVSPRPVEIGWDDLTFDYDKTAHNPTAKVINAINDDEIIVTLGDAQTNAGKYTAEVKSVDNAKYTIEGGKGITQEFVINKRVLEIEWSNTEFVYDGTEKKPTATLKNVIDGDSCTVIVRGEIHANTDGKKHTAELKSIGNTNYTVEGSETATCRFTIKPLVAELEWSNLELKYDGTEKKPDAKVTNLKPGDKCDVTISGAAITVGKHTATATGLSNTDYTLPVFEKDEDNPDKQNPNSVEFEIVQSEVDIKLSSAQVMFGSDLTLSLADNPENAEVTYKLLEEGNTGAATLKDNVLTATKAGDVKVEVTLADTDNYKGGTKTLTVTILKRPIAVEWTQENPFVYNGKVQYPTPTLTNAVDGSPCNLTVEGQKEAGLNCVAKITAIDNPNYSLEDGTGVNKTYTIQPKPITALTWDGDGEGENGENLTPEYPFTGKEQGPSVTASGILAGDECKVTVEGHKTYVGNYTAKATGLSSSNYSLDGITNLTKDFKIVKSNVDIVITTEKVVIGKDETLQITGNIGDGEVTYRFAGDETEQNGYKEFADLAGDTLSGIKLGKVKVRVEVGETSNTYAGFAEKEIPVVKGDAVLKLEKTAVSYGSELTLTMDDDNGKLLDDNGDFMYGEVKFELEPQYKNNAEIRDGKLIPKTAGEVWVIMSVSGNDYCDPTEVREKITISPRIVKLSWEDGTYEYNAKDQAPNVTITNLVEGDDCELVVKGGKDAGDYTAQVVELTGSDSKNYTLESAKDTTCDFTIKPRVLTLTWGETELSYNGEQQVPEVTLSNICEGDTCEVSLVVAEGDHKNVGSYTVTTDVLSSDNYVLDQVYSTGYNINPADLNPSLTPNKVIYNTTETLTLVGNFGNAPYTVKVKSNDSVGDGTFKDGTLEFTATRTGVVKIELNIEKSDNNNAYFGIIEIEVVKAEREAELTSLNGVYGEDLELTISGNDDEPGKVTYVVSDDDMATIDGNVLTPKHAGVVTVTIFVDETNNYKDEEPTVAQITIAPRVAEIHWKNTVFTYNGEVQTPEAEVSNLVGDDKCGVTVIGGQVNAGTYPDARVSVLDNPDYTLDGSITATTIFTIGKKAIEPKLEKTTANVGTPLQLKIKGLVGDATIKYYVTNGSGEATVDENTGLLTPTKTGSVTVTVDILESQNYLPAKLQDIIIIDKSKLNITLKVDTTPYGTELALEVDGNVENSDIKYTVIDDTGSATIAGGNQLVPKRAGRIFIMPYIARTDNYPAFEDLLEFTITPLQVQLQWSGTEFTYDGINRFAPKAIVRSGLINDDVCDVEVEGLQLNAGEYPEGTAKAIKLSSPNYTLEGSNINAPKFVINKADPKISIKTKAVTIGVPTALQVSGNVESSSVHFEMVNDELTAGLELGEANLTGNVLKGTKLGYVHIVAWVDDSLNYNAARTAADVKIEKAEAPLTLEGDDDGDKDKDGIKSLDKKVVYGETFELAVRSTSSDDPVDGFTYDLSIETIDGNTGKASIEGTTLKAEAAGEVIVVIHTEETENYKESDVKVRVTISPRVAEFDWTIPDDLVYDGTEQKPTAVINNAINGDTCPNLVIKGSVNAGDGLDATITDTGNPNYTVEGSLTATAKFNIKPKVAHLTWTNPENNVYSGKEIKPTAVIDNLIGDDEATVEVEGSVDAGEGLTATAVSIKDNSNYTLEGANKTAPFTIKPYEVYITWGELHLTYNGKNQAPEATALDTLNGDVVKAIVSGDGTEVENGKQYRATATKLDSPNYAIKEPEGVTEAKPGEPGPKIVYYYIDPVQVTFQTENFTKEYNGEEQSPEATLALMNDSDDLKLSFGTGAKQKEVGKYTVQLSVTGTSAGNYKLGDDDKTKTFEITRKKVTVKVKTVDMTTEFTGEAIDLTNSNEWYELTCDEFVGADAGKKVNEIFAINTYKFVPKFSQDGTPVESAGQRGKYTMTTELPTDGKLDGSKNYEAVLVLDTETSGTLTIEGGASLQLTAESAYDYIYTEVVEGNNPRVYRKKYSEKNMEHGKDDLESERVILGNIEQYTSVMKFLGNFQVEQYESIRIYNHKNELIYDYGKPAEGITEADLRNEYKYAVGTGWRILYGKDESIADTAYVSVLGDLDGDGKVTSMDITVMSGYIQKTTTFDTAEQLAAAVLQNSGFINAADVASLGTIIQGESKCGDFF